jgi:ABC-type multidrug transport system ATPase subunit
MDEPEASLDPDARAMLRRLIESLVNEGKRVVIATQHEDVVPNDATIVRLS